ncbi:MAG: choice-of-anchor L domain-containing protein [Bacteroidales bacterium]
MVFCLVMLFSSYSQAQDNQHSQDPAEKKDFVRGPVNTPYPDLLLDKSANSAIQIQNYTGTNTNDPNHPNRLVRDLLISGCLQADNIQFSGNRQQIGRFTRNPENTNFPLESGIIISTGSVTDAVGPNAQGNTTTQFTASGDSDLRVLAGLSASENSTRVLDVAVLTFDFIPDGDVVEFRYIFASDEYPEWACSQFNDVFGFFISGPGISGPFSNSAKNIALLPNGSPVSINNIHVGGWNQNAGQSGPNPTTCPDVNANFYVAVPPGEATIEYDGRTTVLTARIENLTPCVSYRIKIAIADIWDRQWDSAVFLEAKSFSSTGNINIRNFFNGSELYDVFQGCGINELRFYRDASSDINEAVTIDYELAGNAVAGTHYTGLTAGTATIPAGQQYVAIPYELPVVSIPDTRNLVVRVNTACPCDATPQWIERTIRIHDPFEVKSFSTVPQSSCINNNGSLTILAGSGNSSYDYVFTYQLFNSANQLVSTQSTGANIELTFPNLGSDSYTIRITEATSCHVIVTDPIVIQGPDSPSLTISSNSPVCEGQTIELTSSSNTSGLTYSWTGPDGFTSDEADPEIIGASVANAGTYSLTVTAPNHCTATRGVVVVVNENPTVSIDAENEGVINCTYSQIKLTASGSATGTYTWTGPNDFEANGNEVFVSLPGLYEVVFEDGNGCTATASVTVAQNVDVPPISISGNELLTCDLEEITLTANVADGVSVLWNDEFAGTTLLVDAPGLYTAVATAANGCTASAAVTVVQDVEVPAISISGNQLLTCDLEEITLTANVADGVSVMWNGEFAGTTLEVTAPGLYTAVATAENGCTASAVVTVVQDVEVPAISISGNQLLTCDLEEITLIANVADGVSVLWNGTIAGSELLVSEPGLYTAVATAENGCTATTFVVVEQNIEAPIVSHDPVAPICIDQLPLMLGNGMYSGDGVFAEEGTSFFTAEEPGIYTIIYSEIGENGCVGSTEVEIAVLALPIVSCPADITIGIMAAPIALTGATPEGGVYSGAGVADGMFSPALAGVGEHVITYTFENEDGCEASCTFVITVISMPDFACIPDFTVCNDDEAFELEQPSYAGGDYSGAGIENNIFNPQSLEPGVYEVVYTLVDEFGYSYSCTFFITVNPAADVTLAAFEPVCTSTAEFALFGGSPAGGSYFIDGVEGNSFNPAEMGTGIFEITYFFENQYGCSASSTQTLEVLQAPCFEIIASDISCFGSEDGYIKVVINSECGSVVDICIEYNDPNLNKCNPDKFLGQAEFTGLIAGTYYIVVTGANGCVTVEEVVINEPALLVATASAEETTICHDAQTIVTITAEGGTAPYQGVGEFMVGAGKHTFIVTDANDCVAEVEITIESFPVPELVCRPDIYIGEFAHTIILEGSTPVGGVYQGPGVSFDAETGNYLFTASDAGAGVHIITYTVEENGCFYTCEFNIEVYEMPDFICLPDMAICEDALPLDDLLAEGDEGVLSGTGIENNIFYPELSGVGAFTITYTIADEFGYLYSCTFIITVNEVPVVELAAFEAVCSNTPAFVLTGGMPEGGVYSGEGVEEGIFDPANLVAGIYQITYTFANEFGCEASATETIEVLQAPCVEVTHTDITCFGAEDGTITVNITCGTPVDICIVFPNEDIEDCMDNKVGGATYTGMLPGTYYVVVTDANGCVTIVEVTIEEPAPLVVVAETEDAACFGETGTASLTITGGTEPYQVDWAGLDPMAIPAGEHTVVVTDANGCIAQVTFVIEQPAEIMADIQTISPTCADNADGALFININGNTDSYIICIVTDQEECFTITGDQGNASWSYEGLAAGIYNIQITDANGCVVTLEAEIVAPAQLEAMAEVAQPLCHDDNGSVEISVIGGTEPYLIHWGDIDPLNIPEGEYQIMVTDANNCMTLVSFAIINPLPLSLSAEITHLMEYGDGTGAISVTVAGGTPPYNFMWDNGGTSATIENLQAGIYFVTVIDANGCIISDEFEVTHPSILVDLGVTIEVNIQTPDPEQVDNLIFALVVTNHDEVEDATGVVVYNPMPASFPFIVRLDDGTSGSYNPATGMWNIGTIPAGGYVILVYRTEMLLSEEGTQFDVNTAQILPFDQIDPNLANNYAEIVVTIGESSGGDDNGIESNGSMAAQLALRNHRRLVESNYIPRAERRNIMSSYSHTDMLLGNLKSSTAEGQLETGISMLLPEQGPADTRAFISTPADLIGITNAKEIFAVDYLQQNNARRAAILAISTEPSRVYEHTKVICDRLVGAELQQISMIEIAGRPFILSQLVHPNGYVDYSVSFIAQRKGDQFVIDNRWYNEEYEIYNTDDIFNFQVWSVTPQFTRSLVEDILQMMEQTGPVVFRNDEIEPAIPQVFVRSGRYTQGGLLLNLVNKVGADQITIYGSKTTAENAQREPMNIKLSIPTNEFVEVFIPTGFIFDAGFSLSNNKDKAPDVLYYADGAWMFDYDPGHASVTHFETFAETTEVNQLQYKVERDASFRGDVRTWASMFRSLSPRNMPVDLTSFDQVIFKASGRGTVEVMLAKAGIHSWSEQYRTTITLSENTREYAIRFSDLVNREGISGFSAEDVVSVIFNPIGNGNASSAFEVNVSNLHFANSLFVVKPNATFYPAFPNPFRNSTSVSLSVTVDNFVRAEVVNSFGQIVEVLANEELSAGQYIFNWDAHRHHPGVYMIRITVGNDTYTTKVIHQK